MGELDFAASLEARVALLKGLETSIFPKIWSRLKSHRVLESLITGTASKRLQGWPCSRGFMKSSTPSRERSLGTDLVRANRLQVSWWPFNRESPGEIITPERKKRISDPRKEEPCPTKSDDCDEDDKPMIFRWLKHWWYRDCLYGSSPSLSGPISSDKRI